MLQCLDIFWQLGDVRKVMRRKIVRKFNRKWRKFSENWVKVSGNSLLISLGAMIRFLSSRLLHHGRYLLRQNHRRIHTKIAENTRKRRSNAPRSHQVSLLRSQSVNLEICLTRKILGNCNRSLGTRNPSSDTYFPDLPSTPGSFCWTMWSTKLPTILLSICVIKWWKSEW